MIHACTYANPGVGEEGAAGEHEGDVDDAVDGVNEHVGEGAWGREVVAETRDGDGLGAASILVALPGAEQTNDEVTMELAVEELGDDEEVGDKGALVMGAGMGQRDDDTHKQGRHRPGG